MEILPRNGLPMSCERCPDEFVSFAIRLADAAGNVHRRYYRKALVVEVKADGSPVTIADKETEVVIRELIEREYPSHGIIGEEYPPTRSGAEVVWIIDPVDGTREFISGQPLFAFLIALALSGRVILGVISLSVIGSRWIGADGHGTRLNGEKIRVRRCSSLRDAVISTTALSECRSLVRPELLRVRKAAHRAYASDACYEFGLLANGQIDSVVAADLDVPDFAALVPVVRNAGGIVTDWVGSPITLTSGGRILAVGDARLQVEMLAALSGRTCRPRNSS